MLAFPRRALALTPVRRLVSVLLAPSLAMVAAAQGTWSGPWDWKDQVNPGAGTTEEFSHAAVIPSGPYRGWVLLWRNEEPTTTISTWLFNPSSPQLLFKVSQGLDTDVFCAAMTWDPDGALVVAGGLEHAMSSAPNAAYRYYPAALESPPAYPVPPSTGPGFVGGSPFVEQDPMSADRYYPSLITLLKGNVYHDIPATPPIPGGSSLVVGGASFTPFGPNFDQGSEYWQILLRGESAWSHTYKPDGGVGTHFQLDASELTEDYVREPVGNPPAVVLDTYPAMYQLTDIANFERNILIAFDTDTNRNTPVDNDPDGCWIVRLRYDPTESDTEYWRGPTSHTSPPASDNDRFYGTSTLHHDRDPSVSSDGRNRVFVMCGAQDTNGPFSSGGYEITVPVQEFKAGANPAAGDWVTKQNGLVYPRLYGNAVSLPTGEILVVGGMSAIDTNLNPLAFAFQPEVFDPGVAGDFPNGTSQVMASSPDAPNSSPPSPFPRSYHNMGFLLPDARVFSVGGETVAGYPDGRFSGEIFAPPYLQQGFRPTILSTSSDTIDFGDTFSARVQRDNAIDGFVLLRPAAITHNFNADQRYIELDSVSKGTAGNLEIFDIVAPDEDMAPPGYYMLFVIEEGGVPLVRVPSVAHFIRLQ